MIPVARFLDSHLLRAGARSRAIVRTLVLAGCTCGVLHAAEVDYTALSLEELSKVSISTLGRTNRTLMDTPAAAYILNDDDIHRSGSTTFADTLRFVPGVQAPRINDRDYAVSARGFNDATSSKLLVLMDGRSINNQISSEANWAYQSVFLPDVDRIEVLRGPGASLWGANAVNGVINVLSKSAHDTLGTLLTTTYGDGTASFVSVRHGWRVTPQTAIRAYLQIQDRTDDGADNEAFHNWRSTLAGWRMDWYRPGGGELTVIGEWRELDSTQDHVLAVLTPPYFQPVTSTEIRRGGNLALNWRQPLGPDGELSLHSSYTREESTHLVLDAADDRYDLDLQVTLHPWSGHEVLTGATLRTDSDRIGSTEWWTYRDPAVRTTFAGAFLQDEISLRDGRWRVTVGTKVERNSYTGLELQPSLRVLWKPTAKQSWWAAISRAARVPSRSERDVRLRAYVEPPSAQVPLPVEVVAEGSADFNSEYLTAYEFGYRAELKSNLSVDFAAFHNEYDKLRGVLSGGDSLQFAPVPHIESLLTLSNSVFGSTTGAELNVRWRVRKSWDLESSFSTMSYNLHSNSSVAQSITIDALSTSTPHWEAKLRSSWRLPRGWTLDALLRRTDRLPDKPVPAYTSLDLRLAWQVNDQLEISANGRDLLGPTHVETTTNYLDPATTNIVRSWDVRLTWRF